MPEEEGPEEEEVRHLNHAFRVYLDPKNMYDNGLYGCYYGSRAIVSTLLGSR